MPPFKAVHQFHSGTGLGDAVTHELMQIRRVLREGGFASEVFAEHIAPGLEPQIRPIADYRGDPAALLIVHHSMGFDRFGQIVTLPDRKLLRYHNITPSHFFTDAHLREYSEIGRAQLEEYRQYVEFGLADSEYNRTELTERGYKYTGVLPIFFDPEPLRRQAPDRSSLRRWQRTFNLLFVGRICRNKRQDDLVCIFDEYHRHDPSSRLILVGSWLGNDDYADAIRRDIHARDLDHAVQMTGAVSFSELVALYRSADVFICASEHEGFCVPLLEAMTFDLPVVAFRAAAVPETLGDGGIVLDDKSPALWADVIAELHHNERFRQEIIDRQRARLEQFDLRRIGRALLDVVDDLAAAPTPLENIRPTIQIQGPFETSYSLAAINRDLAVALDDEGTFDVSIHCTEGPGDYSPDANDLRDKPRAAWLWRKSRTLSRRPDIVIRNLYPPRVHDAPGCINLLLFFWEESLVPREWAEQFNQYLDAILAPSRHVEAALRASGVTIPVHLLHPGVNPRSPGSPSTDPVVSTRKDFRFLNISSGFPRKGIDVLLEAFFSTFSGSDEVALIIKTFPNIHNTVAEQLAEWQARVANPPECIHVDRDIDGAALETLYQEAHCFVYPTRGEGFGLPIAEAMARRIPVIATAYGGHMDFCSDDTAVLVDYELVPSRSHFNTPGAQWAEPNVTRLCECLRSAVERRDPKAIHARVEAAYQRVAEQLNWPGAARRCARIASGYLPSRPETRRTRVAMVTSWDTRCGIAEYSRHLVHAATRHDPTLDVVVLSPPGEGVWATSPIQSRVCWNYRHAGNLTGCRGELRASRYDVVHFQFNFSFFDLRDLGETLDELNRAGTKTMITFHCTADTPENGTVKSLGLIAESLRRVDLILVHSPVDVTQLASFGIRDNVRLFPHGMLRFPHEDRTLRKRFGVAFDPAIGTFGFLLPHKGILELLDAVKMLREDYPQLGLLAQCAEHHDGVSCHFEQTVRERIAALGLTSNVLLSTRFLEPEEANLFLQLADVLVLPYRETAESSSAAVRFALATSRPVITTRLGIFADVAGAAYQIPSCDPAHIAAGVRAVLQDEALASWLIQQGQQRIEATSWEQVAAFYCELLRTLERGSTAGTGFPANA